MALPEWNTREFGCLDRDNTVVASLMRTQLTASLPAPFVSRRADLSAPLDVSFTIVVDDNGMRAWEQWFTYDLNDGSLPFTMFWPWGDEQPRARCRLIEQWQAARQNAVRWQISGRMEIERESLPPWSSAGAP